MKDLLVINEIYLSLQGESTRAGLPCVFVRLTACDLRCSYCDTAYAFTEGKKMSVEDVVARVRELAAPFKQPGNPSGAASNFASSPCEARAGRGPRRGETHNDEPPLPSPLLHPMEEREKSRSLVQSRNPSGLPLVELTGGEPLLQKPALPLMTALCEEGFTVLLETSGAHDIAQVDPRVHCIMDLKCPSSGEVSRNRWENLRHLKSKDEIKFVIGTEQDYDWAKQQIAAHQLALICPILLSWVSPLSTAQQNATLKKISPDQKPIARRDLAERIIADALPVRFQVQMHKVIWAPDARGV